MASKPKYWTGLEELKESPEFLQAQENEFSEELSVDEFVGESGANEFKSGRRDFLKFMGFSIAAATLASCEAPVTKSIPYVFKPEDIVPGVANWYASSYFDGTDFAHILIKTREGRPIHVKGNREHGITGGGVTPRVIGSVLGLYDSERLKGPQIKDAEGDQEWKSVDAGIMAQLDAIGKKGGNIRILTNTQMSPSMSMAINDFMVRYGGDAADMMAGAQRPEANTGDEESVEAEGPVEMVDNAINETVDTLAAAAPVVADSLNNAEEAPVVEETTTPQVKGNANVKWVQYDPVSYAAMRYANEKTFGVNAIPTYRFDRAKVIVSISADFLSNWLMHTQYAGDFAKTRNPKGEWMSRHWQFETLMSITGSNADERVRIKPSQQGLVAAALLNELGGNSGADTSSLDERILAATKQCAAELKKHKGETLVVAGDNDESVQILVNAINDKLGNYGANGTVDLSTPVNIAQGDDKAVEALVKDIDGGKVDALIMLDVNPVYSMPNGAAFAESLEKVGLTVSMAQYADETATNCQYIAPAHHYMEDWRDHNPVEGVYTVGQPVIRPLYDTASPMESFLVWAGKAKRGGKTSTVAHDYIRDVWNKWGYGSTEQAEYATFEDFWNWSVSRGTYGTPQSAGNTPSFKSGAVSGAGKAVSGKAGSEWEVALYQKAAIGTGNQFNNPWLLEMPDPISKVTWDNYITLSTVDAEAGGYNTQYGQESPASTATVTLGDQELTLPVIVQPGQADGTIGIAVGYGRGENGEKIGKAAYQVDEWGAYIDGPNGGKTSVGANAYKLSQFRYGLIRMDSRGAELSGPQDEYPIGATQTHHTVMGRHSVVKETTFEFYKKGIKETYYDEEEGKWVEGFNPAHTLPVHEDVNEDGHIDSQDRLHISAFDLWDEHPVEEVGHRWGMTIDLNTCFGCGSCLIACQSENNVPVVGKDEIRRVRDMFWLSLDRYYSSDQEEMIGKRKEDWSYKAMERPEDNPKVVFMPRMCQHCNHAPCETVCPVAATTHSNEGLNQMTYNRCIGTRYCANNCPYKVRRFNWFNYTKYDKFASFNPAQDETSRMVLNPDVTVRSRGVMEKCSLCVQRIQEGKLKAKKDGRPVIDDDMNTACADACPANAIVFGDLNDMSDEEKGREGSAVYQSSIEDRSYHMLEEVGTKPNIFYKVKVRNIAAPSEEESEA